jgi:cytochrome c biogenesis protein CcmG/thiol:disulfide interchange protein DsbE
MSTLQPIGERPDPSSGTLPAGNDAHPRSGRWPVRRIVTVLVAVATLAILARALLTPASTPTPTSQPGAAAPQVNHYAPNVTLLTLTDQKVNLSSYRGKVVLLNFWYVACEPCQYEMPALEKAYQTYGNQGFVVIGVDITDDTQTITDFTSRLGITYPVMLDLGQRAMITYQLVDTPTSFFIDRNGVIRAKTVGPLDRAHLDQQISTLLKQH